ncbi:MAG: tetrahydromethanopterin S-methyltransferase subunit E [Methanobacteriaceae archaeon]|nr:tetrahydromethanopterin S-methyltransferase subunit E [Methanobacteriaceae archaeon]MDP2837385.1 tetrahydromethanopterin S-methyltransferase subunit E [Methanobacteriaceae archaeon]MDP3485340.1 tetrahydromethanopterin S-methyltransferase subunit E [Methanobacteriaceae archaeon]MDP3624207.1 tetrahydromethanopterin S-methyltransferase subunit E [Methanobacteriaceae archaeon]
MDPMITGLGVVALMGAAATIAGAAEDLESDVGSMSNPNSQVQLAPQMGNLHRMFNKAVSGEPVQMGAWVGIAGSLAFVFMFSLNLPVVVAIAAGAAITALVHAAFATTSHMGRIVSQAQFGQPLYMDVIYQHLGPIAGHGFIVTFCIVGLSYLMTLPIQGLGHPFPLPMLAVLWGITIGAIGSSTGDVHYGAEREYQQYPFGGGIPVAIHGDIVRKAELGARNSMDVVMFCAKYGGPVTGFAFGLIVFLSFWITIVFGLFGGVIAGVVILLLLIIINSKVESFARNKYGPYIE